MTREKTVSKIIEIKEFRKEQIEAEIKKARERLGAEQAKLDALEREYAKTCADLVAKQMKGTMPVTEIELFQNYVKHVGKQIDQQKKVVAALVAEIDAQQKAMIEAYKEQRLFENLHDKIVHDQVKKVNKGEQKEADFTFLCRKAEK
jgi:flagellar export protein FliJ